LLVLRFLLKLLRVLFLTDLLLDLVVEVRLDLDRRLEDDRVEVFGLRSVEGVFREVLGFAAFFFGVFVLSVGFAVLLGVAERVGVFAMGRWVVLGRILLGRLGVGALRALEERVGATGRLDVAMRVFVLVELRLGSTVFVLGLLMDLSRLREGAEG
jgi:hypothetical protein